MIWPWGYEPPERPTPDEVADSCRPEDLEDKIKACLMMLEDSANMTPADRAYYASLLDKLRRKANG